MEFVRIPRNEARADTSPYAHSSPPPGGDREHSTTSFLFLRSNRSRRDAIIYPGWAFDRAPFSEP